MTDRAVEASPLDYGKPPYTCLPLLILLVTIE